MNFRKQKTCYLLAVTKLKHRNHKQCRRNTFDCNLAEVGLGVRVESFPLIQYHLA